MDNDKTGAFNATELPAAGAAPTAGAPGQLRIDSENINENFEVEKQVVITNAWPATAPASCPRVRIAPLFARGNKSEKGITGYDTANYPGRFHGPLAAG
jgi:hypothetical protein